jgi:hypothetical protein
MHAFWTYLFDTLCQRSVSDKSERFFPADKTFTQIYDDFLTPYWRRHYPDSPVPSMSSMKRGRNHPDFKDVKVRPKHFHVRCDTCHGLKYMRDKAFSSGGEALTEYQSQVRLHTDEIKAWRSCEQYWIARAQHSPHEVTTILADDTMSRGFPHFTNRPLKSIANKGQLHIIPWYD